MESNKSQKVFRLTPESLSDEIRVCTTLPQYHVLICVDSMQSKADLIRGLDSLLLQQTSGDLFVKARLAGAQIYPDIFRGDTHVHFRNGSKISFCTHLDISVYAGQDIHSVLVYDKIPYVYATMEYAKKIVEPYKVPSDYDLIDGLFKNTEYIRPIKRREIDTSTMDSFLEEI